MKQALASGKRAPTLTDPLDRRLGSRSSENSVEIVTIGEGKISIQIKNCEPTMHLNDQNEVTMKYSYGNQDEEFVFCYKNRPFSMLVSSSFPTPTTNFIDHLLVQELGIKMTEFQCKKISFGGRKLRLLGKISCTVQCVKNGNVFGNFHLKCSVIEHLNENFDTHCVAGVKTTALLHGDCDEDENSSCTYSGAFTPPPKASKTKAPGSANSTPASISSDCSTPTRILLQKVADGAKSPVESPTDLRRSEAVRALLAARSRSPPGFPATPQYAPSPPTTAGVSPLTSNITMMEDMFGGADKQPHDHAQLRVLRDQHPHGQVTYSNGMTNFYTAEGYDYMLGHGRERCFRQMCYDGAQDVPVPHNCAFSGHWTFPHRFQSCGPRCQGAFCSCLRLHR